MFEQIYDFNNLYEAFKKSRRGKAGKASVAKYGAAPLEATARLSELLRTQQYRVGEYRTFMVYEPKERLVATNNFVDKVVQHALCDNIVEPMLSRSFIRDNYASQKGKGTHDGLDRLAEFMRRHYRQHGSDGWVLKCDISKYFYTIRHEPLREMLHRKLNPDDGTRRLIDQIIDSTPDPGIPIGNQSSQFFALLYLDGLDHYIKDRRGIKLYGRYMDDFYVIHESKAFLVELLQDIEHYLEPLGLTLNAKTQIFPLRHGIDFLGFHSYLTETGKVIRKVRRKSKSNMRRKLTKYRRLVDKGKMTEENVRQSYQSWRGHAEHGNSHHLIQNNDAWFRALFENRKEAHNGPENKQPPRGGQG